MKTHGLTKQGRSPHDTQYGNGSGIILFAVGAVSVFRLLAGLLHQDRLWGIDYLGVFPPWLAAVFTVVPMLAAWLLARTGFTLPDTRSVRRSWIFGSAAVLLISAIAFPMRSAFYGDGGPLLPQIFRLSIGESFDYQLFLNLKSSPLPGFLVLLFAEYIPGVLHLLSLPLPSTPFYPFIALSALMTLVGTLLAVRGRTAASTWILAAFVGTAYGILFFGYAEYYLPVYFFVGFFMIYGEEMLEIGRGTMRASLVFVLAVASHYYAITLLPAFLFLLLRKSQRLNPMFGTANLLRGGFIALAIWLIVYFASGLYASDNRVIMPVAASSTEAGEQTYTLLSQYHLADLANLLLLSNPIALAVIIAVLIIHRSKGLHETEVFRLYLLAGCGMLAFFFFANTSLGLARDWDLTAPIGILLGLAAVALLRLAFPKHAYRATPMFLTANILFFLPWFVMHLDPALSARRFERVIQLDAGHMYRDYALSGYEALRKYYQSTDDAQKDLELTKQKLEILDYPQHYFEFLGKILPLEATNPAAYTRYQTWAVRKLRNRAAAFRRAGIDGDYSLSMRQIDSVAAHFTFTAMAQRRFDRIRADVSEIERLTGYATSASLIAGMERFEQKDYAGAVDAFIETKSRGFQHSRFSLLFSNALSLRSRFPEAIEELEAAVRRHPTDAALHIALARTYLQSGGDAGRTVDLLEKTQSMTLTQKQQEDIDKMLRYLSSRYAR